MHQTGLIYKEKDKDKMEMIKNIIHEEKDKEIGENMIIYEDNDRDNNR